jgi:hypothetical protein
MPLGHYIEHLHSKRFRKEGSDVVLPIEETIQRDEAKRTGKKGSRLGLRSQVPMEIFDDDSSPMVWCRR